MEKYGVDEKKDHTKVGTEDDNEEERCPWCKRVVVNPKTTGGILKCPVHGTEPFE
jgi:ribosomal protein L37AE/L43A